MYPIIRKQTAPKPVVPSSEELAELETQLEDLLDVVWRCEREWRLDDKIALAVRQRPR